MTSIASSCRRHAAWLAAVLAAAGVAALAVSGPAAIGQDQPVPQPTVIRNVRVFDGERVIRSATVVLANRRIAQVALPGQAVEAPADAEVVDGTGRTLLPGLIDAHTHTFSRAQLKTAMAFGVTTELDMATAVGVMQQMKAEQAAGNAADRADLFSAGILVTAPGGHGTEYGVDIPTLASADAAAAFVDARIAEGSDYIKIIHEDGSAFGQSVPTLDVPTMRAVVEAAHARGKMAVAHISSGDGARDAINAGVDGLMHIFADRPPRPDFGRFVADHGVFVVPTLAVLENGAGEPGGQTLIDDPVLGPRLSADSRKNLAARFPELPGNRNRMVNAFAAVRALHEAGVTILAGTDAPNPGTTQGASLHRELELLVHAGLTPVEALTAATSAPARVFGLTDRGRIAPGLRADVVLVDGDPTTNMLATRAVSGIWKEGRRWKLDLYLGDLRSRRASLEAERGGPPPAGAESGLISDFDEPGGVGHPPQAHFGSGWEPSTDAPAGASTVTLTVVGGGAEGSPGALAVRGVLRAGSGTLYAGALFRAGTAEAHAANLSSFRALAFRTRGDDQNYRVLIYDASGGSPVARLTFHAGPDWSDVVLPFASGQTDGRGITSMLFAALGSPRSFSFLIDDVRLR
jgi:imidazolonepropionase-like amidohydrolase